MTPRRGAGGGPASRGVRGTHVPVLVSQVLEALSPRDGASYIDGTFGAGGYARAILDAANCRVLAFDRDATAIAGGQALAASHAPRLTLVEAPFSELDEKARALGWDGADGVVLDLGVSSMQLDTPERGFSFQSDGPLDMRMSREGLSAADVVNTCEEEELARILFELGEERRSRAIARAIVAARRLAPLARTGELAALVAKAIGGRKEEGRHPATRTFQALRIHVNDELGELGRGLAAAERLLRPGGRLAVVSFHSLEDRIVKRFLKERAGLAEQGSRFLPPNPVKFRAPSFRLVNTRPLTPSKGEVAVNPRARSARLRGAERTAAPAWLLGP